MLPKLNKSRFQFLAFTVSLLLLWYLGRLFPIDTQGLQKWLERYPLFARGAWFIVLYVVITFFVFVSKDFFWLAGALLFGAVYSTLFIVISETINAFILFYFSRSLGKGYLDQALGGMYKKLDEKLAGMHFFWLFVFRAAPLIPYRFLDLAAGLTSVRFKKYLAAVILGTPLKTFWMQTILVGVGQNIYSHPYAVGEYLISHKGLYVFSLVYLLLVVLAFLKIKHTI